MRLVIAYLLILKSASCYDLFVKNTCVGDVEIAFSTNRTDFNGARESCQNFGGDLVKIGSAEMQAVIENAIPIERSTNPQHNARYIGAYNKDRDNEYNWLVDNTSVPKNPVLSRPGPSNGYQNWKVNQPNNVNEKCVALGVHSVHTWSDVICDGRGGKRRYICQRDFSITVRNASNSATCQSPLSSVGVRWERNSAVVESSDNEGVYQTIGTNNATLNYESANITEAGTYTCTTKNSSCSATKTYTLAVDGAPTIRSAVGNKCNASLFVTWEPNKAAVGFIHKISVNETATTLYVTPTANRLHTTEISGLEPNSEYTVQIRVCKEKDNCTTSFTAQLNGTTDGVTDRVTSATIRRSGVSCNSTWSTCDNSATYTIETECALANSRYGRKPSTNRTEYWKTTTFSFQPGPNSACSATIWAKGCRRISSFVKTRGSCTTPPKEPDRTKPAELEVNGTFKIVKLARPSEANGLISCIFIVLCYNECSETQFTVQDLEKASQTDVTNNTDQANSIALAISMSSVSRNQISCKLSQREVTRCDLNNTGLITAGSTKVLNGNNLIHNSTKKVWVYIVTSTPSEGQILLKTSSPTVLREKNETGPTTLNFNTLSEWVIRLLTGLAGIVIGIGIGIFIARRLCYNVQGGAANQAVDQSQAVDMQAISRRQESDTLLQPASSGVAHEEVQQADSQNNEDSSTYLARKRLKTI